MVIALIILSIVAVVVILKRAFGVSASGCIALSEYAKRLTLQDVLLMHNLELTDLTSPPSSRFHSYPCSLEIVVALRDRADELLDLEHGPLNKAKHRNKLIGALMALGPNYSIMDGMNLYGRFALDNAPKNTDESKVQELGLHLKYMEELCYVKR